MTTIADPSLQSSRRLVKSAVAWILDSAGHVELRLFLMMGVTLKTQVISEGFLFTRIQENPSLTVYESQLHRLGNSHSIKGKS